jgi:hypothetical protein
MHTSRLLKTKIHVINHGQAKSIAYSFHFVVASDLTAKPDAKNRYTTKSTAVNKQTNKTKSASL